MRPQRHVLDRLKFKVGRPSLKSAYGANRPKGMRSGEPLLLAHRPERMRNSELPFGKPHGDLVPVHDWEKACLSIDAEHFCHLKFFMNRCARPWV